LRDTIAVEPAKLPEATEVPLLETVTFVMKPVLPVPVFPKVTLVIVAGALLVLSKTTC
jgi:hypothetical protein